MNRYKKAPTEVAASVLGAHENNQVQDTTDYGNCQEPVDPVIPELVMMCKRACELFEFREICSIGSCGDLKVQMGQNSFFEMFSFGECDTSRVDEYDRYTATVDGVEFFCLVKKEEDKDVSL